MMSNRLKLICLTAIISLSGCSTTAHVRQAEHSEPELETRNYPVMAVPLQATLNREIEVAKLNQLLTRPDLKNDERAIAHYRRGQHFEKLGLKDLARIDYGQSLRLNPAQPDIFNHLGVYFTQHGEFDAAYEAFDSTLELDPNNPDALHNRAVALYYGGRNSLALEDMKEHYSNDPSDPYRAIWLYIIECEKNDAVALRKLSQDYQNRDGNWGWVLAGIVLGEISEEEAVNLAIRHSKNNKIMAQRLTEIYFYLGKKKKSEGQVDDALSLYKLAISFNVFDYVEHSYSFLELERIYAEYKKQTKSEDVNLAINKS